MRKNKTLSIKEAHMNTIADELVSIQTSSESAPSMPSWFGESTCKRQLRIHQDDILHRMTFFLAALMAFLLSRVCGTLDASLGAIMAKRGGLSWLGASCPSSSGGTMLSANRCANSSIDRAGASPSLLSVICKTGNKVWIHWLALFCGMPNISPCTTCSTLVFR